MLEENLPFQHSYRTMDDIPETAETPEQQELVDELLSSGQALFLAILFIFLTAIALLLYRRHLNSLQEAESLGMKYQFAFPQEKQLYEKKLLEEPEETDKEAREKWQKEISAILLRRAIMSLSLNMKINQDYRSYYMIYKSGINLDIWSTVQKAKELIDKEIKVIQQEAEWLKPGWGKMIFAQANQLRNHMLVKQKKMEAEKKKALEEELKKKKEAEQSEKAYKELMSKASFVVLALFFLSFFLISC